MRGRDEGKVPLQPSVLGAKRVWNGHGLGGDEDFKPGRQVFEYPLRVGHQGQVFKKVLGVKKGAELLLAVERGNFPQSLSSQVFGSHCLVKGLVVAAQVFGERIRHHLIHVYTDALHLEI